MAAGFLAPDEALLVLGSLNANPDDRSLDRARIQPAQLVSGRGTTPLTRLRSWGELGISSIAWHPERPLGLYVTTGDDLRRLDLADGGVETLDVPRLEDVHEMTVVGDQLWLANTALDEAVAVDLPAGRPAERVGLTAYRGEIAVDRADARPDADETTTVDRFHCNQIVEGFDGHRYALVHHVSGRQLIQRIARKLIKSHGDGGLLDLDTGDVVPLRLKAPHTVRRLDGRYWVLDSGNARLNIYRRDWELERAVPTAGWGRGAAASATRPFYFAGISATRRRYRHTASRVQTRNLVQVFGTDDAEPVGEIVLDEIEQINNVYRLSAAQADRLLEHFG